MQRLLQGEVGSGKTVVAVAAMMQAVGSGGQAVLVAPTQVLAEQRSILDRGAALLLEKETLNAEALAQIFAPVHKRPVRPVWLSSDRRTVSDAPPVLTPAERAKFVKATSGVYGQWKTQIGTGLVGKAEAAVAARK